jgi:exopolysaccharide biosynthesis protein
MKKLSVSICVYLWTIFLFVSINAQDFKVVRDGVEYAELERMIAEKPVRMNLLRLDLRKVRLDVEHAMDAAIGLEKTSSIATRHGAFAAINAGFFRLDTSIFAGDAVGILQINGKLLSESYSNRIALGINNKSNKTNVVFGRLNTRVWVSFGNNNGTFEMDGINRESKPDEAILYTPEFKQTPPTISPVTEVLLSDCRSVCWKWEIIESSGGTTIPKNGFVFSLSGAKRNLINPEKKKTLLSNSKLVIVNNLLESPNQKRNNFKKTQDIIGGVPQLIRDGKIDITWQEEKSSKAFVETRHPRTAVAKLKDGKFLMITVDGRSEQSAGIGLEDLARLFLELGATDAMNLDGGGSTTMFVDGKVVNKPSDKEGERRVSDAILVFPRKKS